MASSLTQSHERRGEIGVVILTATCHTDGTFTSTAIETEISGELLQIETNPGSPAPTSNYDITITDEEGLDVLQGVGANRHTTTTELANIVFSGTNVHPVVHRSDTLTLVIAGQSVSGAVIVIKLYYRGVHD